jgi:uncharacterized membrane protein YkvA (DUF1232 family)
VIGFLDDLVLIPAGIILLIKMIPAEVMEECRKKTTHHHGDRKEKHWLAAGIIVLIWILSIYLAVKSAIYILVRQ